MDAQIKDGYAVKVAEFAKERAARYADNPELLIGMVTLLAGAIIDPPKRAASRPNKTPKRGTITVSVNGKTPVVVDPYVSAATTMRNMRALNREDGALSDFNFLTAARALLKGREVEPYYDGNRRELTEKTAAAALKEWKLHGKDGRTFKTWLRKEVCKRHGMSAEKLTELTR